MFVKQKNQEVFSRGLTSPLAVLSTSYGVWAISPRLTLDSKNSESGIGKRTAVELCGGNTKPGTCLLRPVKLEELMCNIRVYGRD